MGIKFANNAASTLASPITNVDTSLSVATGNGSLFPSLGSGDFFYCTLENGATREIVKVTGRTGDVFTIVRAQEGTTALNWSSGATVSHRITAASLGALSSISINATSKTTGYTAAAGDNYPQDTSGGGFTVTLPASPNVGDAPILIHDIAGTFSANNLVLGRNGNKIMGLSEDCTIKTNNVSVWLLWSGATYGWRFV